MQKDINLRVYRQILEMWPHLKSILNNLAKDVDQVHALAELVGLFSYSSSILTLLVDEEGGKASPERRSL